MSRQAALVFRDQIWKDAREENARLKIENNRLRDVLDSLHCIELKAKDTTRNQEESYFPLFLIVKPQDGQFCGDVWTYSITKRTGIRKVLPCCAATRLDITVYCDVQWKVSNYNERGTAASTADLGEPTITREENTIRMGWSDLISIEGTICTGNDIADRKAKRKRDDDDHVDFVLTSISLSVSRLVRKTSVFEKPLDAAVTDSIKQDIQLFHNIQAALGGGDGLLEENFSLKFDNHQLSHAYKEIQWVEIRSGDTKLAHYDIAAQGRPGGASERNANDDHYWTIDLLDNPLRIPLPVKLFISGVYCPKEGFPARAIDGRLVIHYSMKVRLVGRPLGSQNECLDFSMLNETNNQHEDTVPSNRSFDFEIHAIELYHYDVEPVLELGALEEE